MSSSRLGAILLRRSKTLTLISELRGSRVSNDPSLLSSSRFVSTSCRLYREPSSSSFLSRYRRSLYGFKSFPKTLFGPPKRQMTTSAAVIGSTKLEITSSGLKMLVAGGTRAQKMVGIWLFGCAAWVFSMVVLGGVTRLTRSGLSMTDWKFTGGLPPLTEEEWLLEFEKYQQSPEYKRVNKGMSLGDFKFIFWMEYAHRMWGRGLGLMFALPFSYFLAKGFITRQLGLRLSVLFALGGGQGLIGWWMVKSGLEEPASEYVQPRVSPYRLATHLISAFVIYCGIFWTALSVVMPEPPNGSISWVNCAAKVRKMALPLSVLVGITAFSGDFVAGNDAGHAYNTFPKMGDSWIPDDIFSMEPLVRNFFENTSTVQALYAKILHQRGVVLHLNNLALGVLSLKRIILRMQKPFPDKYYPTFSLKSTGYILSYFFSKIKSLDQDSTVSKGNGNNPFPDYGQSYGPSCIQQMYYSRSYTSMKLGSKPEPRIATC